MHDMVNQLRRHRRELEATLGRPPTDEEGSIKMGIKLEKLRQVDVNSAITTVSYETSISSKKKPDGSSTTLQSRLADSKAHPHSMLDRSLMSDDLKALLTSRLSEREANVLRLRYGLDDGRTRTLEEIGRGLEVTRERVRQIESRALQKLRAPQAIGRLADYKETLG